MKPNFIEFICGVADGSKKDLLVQTATGTYIGTPVFEDSKNFFYDNLMDIYDKSSYADDKTPASLVVLENVRCDETGSKFEILIFFLDSILAVSLVEPS